MRQLVPARDKTWHHGQSFFGGELENIVHIVRSPRDPERRGRAKSLGGCGNNSERSKLHWSQVKKLAPEVCADAIVALLDDDAPRTFNQIGIELWDKTADILWQTNPDRGLWLAVTEGRVEHTSQAPVLFRRRR